LGGCVSIKKLDQWLYLAAAGFFWLSSGLQAATDVSGPITTDTVWSVAQSPYQVTSDVSVENGATLTIEPGVTVYFGPGTNLIVNTGALRARGTAVAPIVFTSIKESSALTPAPGDWGQLRMLDGTNDVATVLEYVQIKYGRGIVVQSASPTFNYLNITDNAGPAISIDLNSSPQGVGNQTANNVLNGIAVPAGDIMANVAWKLKGIPYVVSQGTVSVGQTPVIIALSPNAIQQGETLDITVTGMRLSGVESIAFDDPNISATVLPGGTDTLVPLRISVGVLATLGSLRFQIQILAGIARFDAITTGVGIIIVPKQPKITAVSPVAICKDQSAEITISGVNFLPTSVATLDGADLTTTYISAISVKATVPGQSVVGKKSIKLKTPNSNVPGEVFVSNAGEIQINNCVLACTAPPSGLIGWWAGDGNASDLIGVNNGALQNGATFAAGKVGQAFSLDGVDDYVNLGSSPAFDMAGDFTIHAWVSVDPTKNIGDRRVISRDDFKADNVRQQYLLKSSVTSDSTSPSFTSACGGATGRPVFGVFKAGAGGSVCAPNALSAGFHHLAGVRSGSTILLYVDGALVASRSAISGILAPEAPLVIGQANPTVNTEFFNGLIDEAAIHNRALSASEIQAIFAAGGTGMCKVQCTPPPTNIVSWWSGDGNANDIAGVNHGALQNGVTFAPGKVGQAFSFDGIDDFVSVPDAPS
jgi:hypothetical protein